MKLIAALFFTFLCVVLFMANTGQQSIVMDIKNSLPYGDKIGHFCMYGSLTLFANYAFKFRYFTANKMNQYGTVLVLLFSTTEEFSQIFIATRTFSFADMAANFTGITLFTLLSIYLGKQSNRYNQRLIISS
ncbi:VanZ family protein [Thalassotalea nanhaiensis]|uniref:VanZ family protein n=1 Tax=Thalassotalea nanhaiensis TaxID=3065648 RepID=A0ABY9TJ59_9GAMM|nr:VanZ family protein [Colwelliaceae bacterium SQ345]